MAKSVRQMRKSNLYILFGNDGDCEMRPFYPEHVQKGKCSHCGLLDTYLYHDPHLKLKSKAKRMDFCTCYDVGEVVSLRFKEICVQNSFDGLEFVPFDSEPGFYQLYSKNIAKIDIGASNLEFNSKCPICNKYKSITRTGFEIINKEEIINRNTIFSIDIGIGSNSDKSKLFIINEVVLKIFRKEKVKSFCISKVGVIGLESGSKPIFSDEEDQNSFDRGDMDFEKFKKEQWDLDNQRIGIYSDFF